MAKDFSQKVLMIVAEIPRGKLLTYAQVAKKAGSPRAYRAVGSILRRNYRQSKSQLPLDEFEPVPCHRVIRSDGFAGGYARGEEEKEKMLRSENHIIESHKVKDFDLNS